MRAVSLAAAPTYVENAPFRAKFEGDAVVGSGEVVDGVYRFSAAQTDGEAWHVKLECNYPTVAGRDYRVTYRFRSDVAGKVKFGDFQEFEIRKGDNAVTGILIAESGTSYLDLQLGMLPPFTIDFTEIEVEEYADEVDYEDALPAGVDFEDETRVYEKHDQGYGVLYERSADAVALQYVAAPWDPGVWKSRLYVKTGFVPETGARYHISADVMCDQDMPFEVLFNDADAEKGYGALYGQKLAANEVSGVEAVITGSSEGEELIVQFSLGEVPEGATVTVGNLRVEKVTDHYTNVLPAGFALDKEMPTGRILTAVTPSSYTPLPLNAFSYEGTDTVSERHDGDYAVSLTESDSAAVLNIEKAPESERNVWKVKLIAATGVEPEPGSSYRVRFDLTGERDQAEYEVCFDGSSENAYGVLYSRSLRAGVPDSVDFTLTPTESAGPLSIRLQLGKTDTAAGNRFTLSNFTVEKISSSARDLGAIPYGTGVNVWEGHGDGLEQSLSASGSAAELKVSAARSEGGVWSSRLYVDTGFVPEAGQRYRVSATLASDKAIDEFELVLDKGAEEDGYHAKRGGLAVAAGGSVQLSSDFTAPQSGCETLVLRFQLGNSPADNTVTVSDIRLCPLSYESRELALPGFAYPTLQPGSSRTGSFLLENNEGAEAELSGDGSSATATVKRSGDDWHIKLYAKPGVTLEQGKSYRVSLKAENADGCELCFKNLSVEGEEGFGKATVASGSVSHLISPAVTGELELILKLGALAEGTAVKVSGFKLEEQGSEYSEMELTGFAYPVTTAESGAKNAFDLECNQGAEAVLSGDGSSATATVVKPGDDWHIKFYAKPGLTLEAGKRYRISLEASGADGCSVFYKRVGGDEDSFGTETLASGRAVHIVSPGESGELELILKLGTLNAGTAVTITKLTIEEEQGVETALSFSLSYPDSFFLENNEGAGSVLSGEGSSASATVTKPGDGWHIKLYTKPHVTLEQGKSYRVTMDVSSADGCEACFKNLSVDGEEGFGKTSVASGRIDHVISSVSTAGELEIILKLGALAENTVVSVANLQIKELSSAFTDVTPAFAWTTLQPASTEPGSFQLENNEGADSVLSGDGSSASATVVKSGDGWHIKLYAKPHVTLEAGKSYQISFNTENADGCEVCFKNLSVEGEEGFGKTNVASGRVSHTVSPSESGELEIILKLGALAEGTRAKLSALQIKTLGTSYTDITPAAFAYPEIRPGSGEKNSFDLEANEGAEAELSGDGSSATATVVKPGDDWHIKLYAKPGVTLEAGKSYEIRLSAANAEGCGVFYKRVGGEEDSFGTETLSSGRAVHFVSPSESGELELLLKLGTLPAGTAVTVTELRLFEAAETVGEDLLNLELRSWAPVNFWAHEDYAASLSDDGSSATLAIASAPDEGREDWKVKLFAETGIKLESGKSYRVSADVSATKELPFAICCNDGPVEAALGRLDGQTASASARTFVKEFTAEADAELILQFNLGSAVSGTAVTVSGLKVEELSVESAETVIPGFRYDSVGFISSAVDPGYLVALDQHSDSADFTILQAPEERKPWNAKLYVRTGFTPEPGKGYRVSFDLNAAKGQQLFEVFYDGDTEAAYGALYEHRLPVGGSSISRILMPGSSRGELVLQLRFGCTDGADGNRYTLSKLRIEEVGFTSTSTPEKKETTTLWTHDSYTAALEKTPERATVRMEKTPAEGMEPWKTKLFVETGVKLRAGQKYRISMDVKSIIPAPFEVCFNNGEVEKGLGAVFNLMATPYGQPVSYTAYVKEDTQLVLQLSLGRCTAPNSIILSGVKVEKAGAIELVSDTVYSF